MNEHEPIFPFQTELNAYKEHVDSLNAVVEKLQQQVIDLSQNNEELTLEILEYDIVSTQENEFYHQFFDYFNQLPAGLIVFNIHGTIQEINLSAAEFFSSDKNHLMGTSLRQQLSYLGFSDFTKRFTLLKESEKKQIETIQLQLKNEAPFSLSICELDTGSRKNINPLYVGVIYLNNAYKDNFISYISSIAMNQLREGLIITDIDGTILMVNDSFTEITGYTREEAVGNNPRMLKSGRHGSDFYDNIWQSIKHHSWWAGEIWNKRKNGQVYPEWLQINRFFDPYSNNSYYTCTFSDITERKESQIKLDHLAHFDTLTGLMNRHFITVSLEGMLERSNAKQNHQIAVMFIDLDLFKQINDRFGHHEGDLVLQEASQRLITSVRNSDLVGRIGGDEFVIIFPRIDSKQILDEIACKILDLLGLPFIVNKNNHKIGASIGVSIFPQDGDNCSDLMKRADAAMYRSKAQGRNQVSYFERQDEENIISYEVIKKLLIKTIDKPDKYLQVVYQPIINASTHKLFSFEALVRIIDDENNMIFPDQFISLAENENLIEDLGEAIFKQACRFRAENIASQLNDFPITINLSPIQLGNVDTCEKFIAIAEQFGLKLSDFGFEITETAAMQNLDLILHSIHHFKQAGSRIYLDDFGTGYASISQLHKIPVDVIKLDKSFTDLIDDNNESSFNLLKAIFSMSDALQLDLVVEGVENKLQFHWLKKQNIRYIQGYYFSKPQDENTIRRNYLDDKP